MEKNEKLGGQMNECDHCNCDISGLSSDNLVILCVNCATKTYRGNPVTRENIKALLYDLGFRGMTDKQKEICNKFCEVYRIE